jgi:hypothetical protein
MYTEMAHSTRTAMVCGKEKEEKKENTEPNRRNAITEKQRKANLKGGSKPLPENSGAIFGVPHFT